MSYVSEDILQHYGVKRRSGRYPWGSGDEPYQHNSRDFLSRIEELKKQGWTETPENIKEAFGLSTTQYRTAKTIAGNERRALKVATAKSLVEDGLSTSEIGRRMGVNESTVRSWLNEKSEARMNQARKTADQLKALVDERGMIDVGGGTEIDLGISQKKLNDALTLLQMEGYPVHGGRVEQVTNPGRHTTLRVLCPPGTEHKEIYNYDQIHTINDYTSSDGGETFRKFVYPKSMDSNRLMIRYHDDVGPDGARGVDKDGVIELRRGVEDLSLGDSRYSQVRILVDNNKYLKGMAIYSDNMPDGVDVVFNTNKKSDVPKMEVLKNIKDDPENPFGSLIKANGQSTYIDKNGKEQLSLINKRADEGDWSDWKDKLPSQFLSKQTLPLAKKQLGIAIQDKESEYADICSLTNPTVKKHFLNSFAEDCDKAAVTLQAAALPKQKYHVIIPINSLKDNEVYAPNYENGTKLALIRYPHGGTFEIPILTVNNKHDAARKLLGTDVRDAVGINSKNAERLSGADFDGDTVMCIPTGDKVNIKSTNRLKDLEGFDNKAQYQYDSVKEDSNGTKHYYRNGKEFRIMGNTNTQMGIISNLITDMTLQGATESELARAVKHSMVVIDAEKHKLDYRQSEIDNGIASLKKKYQSGGASTLISRAKAQQQVDKRQGSPKANIKGKPWYDPDRPEGSLIYTTADDVEYTVTKTNKKTGVVTTETRRRHDTSTRMAETDDAYTLISDANTRMEQVYADYANTMKAMANQARKEMYNTGKVAYSASAKAAYEKEVRSLNDKLDAAERNRPVERYAQLQARAEVDRKKAADPDMNKSDVKKAGQQALTKYRSKFGAKRNPIDITDREWEAIQAGAISENILKKILKNTDADKLRERATPRTSTTLSAAKISKLRHLRDSGATLSEIAKSLGVSTSTVSKYLKGAN